MDPTPKQGLDSAETHMAPPSDAVETATGSPATGSAATGSPATGSPATGSPESAGEPTTPGPVATIPAAPARRSRARWVAAALVVVAVLVAAAAALVFLSARPLPEALRYTPADSAIVVEIRPELPGDQREHLGNLLAHFPGFADQSSLTAKIDEALDRLVRQAGNGSVDYATQVKPLLAGPMVISATAADMGSLSSGKSSGKTPAGLLVVATTDGKATCDGTFGATTAGDTYRAVALRTIAGGAACALDGRFMLVGTAAAVEHGIDARLDNKGIDGNGTFRDARARLSGDQLALAYLNGKAVASTLATLQPSLAVNTTAIAAFPEWLVAGLRVVDDAVQLDLLTPPMAARLPSGSGLPTDPPPARSQFAAMLPANAFGFVEAHGMGANIQRAFAQLQADPAQAATLAQLEAAIGSVGGIGNLAGWIEDLGVAAVPVGDSAGAVVLVRGADAAAAQSRLDQIRNLLSIASIGTDIGVKTTDHNGTPVTSVDLGDLGPALQGLGAPAGILPSGSHVTVTMAAADGVLMLGVGDGVIEAVLDTNASHSLAAADAYARAVERAGTSNDVEVFLAIDTIAGWLESHPPTGTDLTDFNANVKPYLDHLAGAIETTVTTSTGTQARIVITVK